MRQRSIWSLPIPVKRVQVQETFRNGLWMSLLSRMALDILQNHQQHTVANMHFDKWNITSTNDVYNIHKTIHIAKSVICGHSCALDSGNPSLSRPHIRPSANSKRVPANKTMDQLAVMYTYGRLVRYGGSPIVSTKLESCLFSSLHISLYIVKSFW